MSEWKIFRTRYLVKARQLTETTVILDELGRFQTGQPGDYLVECSDGTHRVSPRHIFEDVYVEMSANGPADFPARTLQMPVQPGNPAD